jgi:hypothetical protein
MRKAFGGAAGLAALAVPMAVFVTLCGVLYLLHPGRDFPTMVVLGLLMVVQYLYWRKHCRVERTTWQYLQAEGQGQTLRAPVAQL